MDQTDVGAVLTARARKALGSTQPWANFAGVASMSVALLAIIRGVARLFMFDGGAAGTPHGHPTAAYTAGIVIGTLWVAGFNGALGWLALRYGGALERVRILRQPPAGDVSRACRLQHSFWRLQAVLWIIAVALLVLGAVFAVIALLALRR